ncbi:unnamed protein product, partial [Brachionus calyciflorus]
LENLAKFNQTQINSSTTSKRKSFNPVRISTSLNDLKRKSNKMDENVEDKDEIPNQVKKIKNDLNLEASSNRLSNEQLQKEDLDNENSSYDEYDEDDNESINNNNITKDENMHSKESGLVVS